MKDIFELTNRIRTQGENRLTWQSNDTKEVMEAMIVQEHDELKQAIAMFDFVPHAELHLIAEAGDVGYLYLSYKDQYPGEPPPVVREAITEALNTATRCGFSLSDAVELKLIRNSLKHADVWYDGFTHHQEAMGLASDFWRDLGGDDNFFRAFEAYVRRLDE